MKDTVPDRLPCPNENCMGYLVLIKSKRAKNGHFWGCVCYPMCSSSHGAHPYGRPMGKPAGKVTRMWRQKVHEKFDTMLNNLPEGDMRKKIRKRGYRWLARIMDWPEEEAHIATFDISQCKKALKLMNENEHVFQYYV